MNEKHIATIRTYYDGCNEGNVEKMMSTLATDVVHYFTGYRAVKGSTELATHWATFQSEGRVTRWTVDHAISEGDEAVIEWTMNMTTTTAAKSASNVVRGTEWYVFKSGKISEIRAYYCWNRGVARSELESFPYSGRAYTEIE